MFGHENSVQQLQINYWLPVKKVNVTGTVVKATSSHGEAAAGAQALTGEAGDARKATPAVSAS